jgi:acetyl esterase/lipase
LAAGSVSLHYYYALLDGDWCYFTTPDPITGRVMLHRSWIGPQRVPTGEPELDLYPEHSILTKLYEYGGGAFAVAGGYLVFVDQQTQDLWVDRVGVPGARKVLRKGGRHRYGSLSINLAQGVVLAVCETMPIIGESELTIISVPLAGGEATLVASGADFYANPVMRDDGLVAWCEWDHPNMPWDSTRICIAGPDHPYRVRSTPGYASVFPAWMGDDLVFLSDTTGYWNFHRVSVDAEANARIDYPYDFCGPIWNVNQPPYTVIDADHIGCWWLVDGMPRLGVAEFSTAHLDEIPTSAELAFAGSVMAGAGRYSAATLGFTDRPEQYVLIDWEAGTISTCYEAGEPPLPPGYVSTPAQLAFQGAAGEAYAWYFPPTNAQYEPLDGELPPVLVLTHGGPTAFSDCSLRPSIQFWTTRGIAVLDVNYSGSTGYGRAYRDRLQGQWGVLDVSDCVDAVRALIDKGLADPQRVFIKGGSAGGYTTLRALTSSDVFAGGISLYGVSDLEALTCDTHKFESRYLDGLVAPYPERRDVYLERSPIYHLDQLNCPMLVFQGGADKIVPPDQATTLVEAVRAKGLQAELVIFPDEGHGFRTAASNETVLVKSLEFINSTGQ